MSLCDWSGPLTDPPCPSVPADDVRRTGPTIYGTAQQMITALLHGDPATAVQIVGDIPNPRQVAFAAADIAHSLFRLWARTLRLSPQETLEAWARILTNVEAARATGAADA